jgi:hypothetical protein
MENYYQESILNFAFKQSHPPHRWLCYGWKGDRFIKPF